MSGAHTPGPWTQSGLSDWYPDRYEGSGSFSWTVIRSESADSDLAIVIKEGRHDDPELDANARLIVASPELLEAAEAVLGSTYAVHYRLISPFKELAAAVAKAKGGAA